jgi:hypothetical protein
LHFEGPHNGTLRDASNGNPIAGATVVAAWWCYDFPYPHIGEYWVYASATTDDKGHYEIKRPSRRSGWFGQSFTLRFNAKGYIEAVFALEPRGLPLPPSTKEYPFVDTTSHVSFPANLDILLKPARPALLKALTSDNPQYRWVAAEKLGGIGKEATYAVGPLILALGDHDTDVRKYTAKALGKIGPGAVSAVPALVAALQDEDEWVRLEAVDALGAIGHGDDATVGALTRLLDDKEDPIRTHAVRSLSKLGPRAKGAVPSLTRMLGQRSISKYLHREVEYALEKIDPDTLDKTSTQ